MPTIMPTTTPIIDFSAPRQAPACLTAGQGRDQLPPCTDWRSSGPGRELAYVRQQLRACPSVQNAFVTRRPDRTVGRELVAYVLAFDGAVLSLAALRSRLVLSLAPGQMPTTFIILDAFVLLENGDIDQAALPAPDSAALGMRQYEAPHGPVEKTIARIWSEVLGVEQIGRQGHFFELGGNSALAVQTVYRLRQEMEVDVAMRDLLLEPVLERFACTVSARIRLARFPLAAPVLAP